jgi:hypothetical protein
MPADLTVVAVRLPAPLRAPCPLPVLVVIQNIGTDPADRTPYDVTIDLAVGETTSAHFEETVQTPEDQQLSPGRTIVVPIQVQFPCTSPVMLRATVDKKQQVANNLRSASYKDVTGLTPTPVPWLTTTLQVGIRSSTGSITWDPDGFCPGKEVIAAPVIENKGCLRSNACTVELTLEDAQVLPVMLDSKTFGVPGLVPGGRYGPLHSLATPLSAAGTSGALSVNVRADVKVDNPDQCDRAQLNARVVKPFAAGSPPQLTLGVGGAHAIRPGETPSLSWRVRNDCNEIGPATVKVLFGNPPTKLYETQTSISLRSTVEEDVASNRVMIPQAIEATFWSVGAKSLELEVTGTGSDPGPYQISVPLYVVPEPIDATWWTWTAPPYVVGPFWKTPYTVVGSFTNRGRASMTVNALPAVEHPTDVTGTTEDKTLTPFGGTVGTPVLPGASVAATWASFQGWTWLTKDFFIEVGPRSREFTYVATISLTDQFGNAYPLVASAAATATVSVFSLKLEDHNLGLELLGFGLYFLAVAAAVGTVGGYAWIAAAFIAAGGMACIISARFYFQSAYDPPVPDFREHERMLVDPQAWNISEPDDERLHPLHALALLLVRLVSARLRAVRHRDRAWAADLDRADSRRVHERDAARNEIDTLRRLVTATTNTAGEAQETFEQLVGEVEAVPTLEDLQGMTGRFADELRLNDQERGIIDQQLAAVDQEMLPRSLERARSDGLAPIGELARRVYETTASQFAGLDYLR